MSESKGRPTTAPRAGGTEDPPPSESTTLSEQERLALEAEIRAELEAEHQARLERVARRREELSATRELRQERVRQSEIARMREDVRRRFYQERGYERVEEHGRERWIPREEFDLRGRGKQARVRNTRAVGSRAIAGRYKWVPLYILLILVATALGAFVVR